MKLAVIFNGQGAHYQDMGLDFAEQSQSARDIYANFERQTQLPIRQWISEDITQLNQTRHAQPSIVATSLAIYEHIRPEFPAIHFMAGLSLGEYSALIASGMLTLHDGISLLQKRGELMSTHCADLAENRPAQMVAVMGTSATELRRLLAEHAHELPNVYIANLNSSQQTILAGEKADIATFSDVLKNNGIKKVMPLKVEGPFHSPLMEPACAPFAQALASITFQNGNVPVISNTTLSPHEVATVKGILVRHLVEPVRWQETIEYLINEGVTHLIQIGPGNTLAQLLRRQENAPQCLVIDKVEDVEKLEVFLQGENL